VKGEGRVNECTRVTVREGSPHPPHTKAAPRYLSTVRLEGRCALSGPPFGCQLLGAAFGWAGVRAGHPMGAPQAFPPVRRALLYGCALGRGGTRRRGPEKTVTLVSTFLAAEGR
jgi:hypothetical protein